MGSFTLSLFFSLVGIPDKRASVLVEVLGQDLARFIIHLDFTVLKPDDSVAYLLQKVLTVTGNYENITGLNNFPNSQLRLLLERGVANGKPLVHHQDLGFDGR
jgi:hypothetical protein